MKLRDLLREQEETEAYRVAIELDSGTIVLTVPIPMTALQRDDIEERLRAYIEKHKNAYNIDDTSFSTWYPVDDENNRVELPDVNLPDVEIPDPTDDGTEEPERNVATPGETEPEEEPEMRSSGSVRFIGPMEDFAMRYNRNVTRQFDRDRDYRNDETGELQPRMTADGQLVDENGQIVGDIDDVVRDNPELLGRAAQDERTQQILQNDMDGDGIIDDGYPNAGEPVEIRTEPYDVPTADTIQNARDYGSSLGGGADGDTGDEGFAGEEGAVTGEQRAEIPSIIEELYRSISGLGTNETRMINALKRIGSPAHLEAVVEMYRETYNSSLPQDIIGEFRFQGGNTGKVIDEVNAVMRPLGWQLVGSQWFNLRWEKLPGVEVEIEPAGEE